MIALLWPVAAYAINYTGEVCVDVGVEYDDLGGDRWLDNDVAKAGRGLRVKVVDVRDVSDTGGNQGEKPLEGQHREGGDQAEDDCERRYLDARRSPNHEKLGVRAEHGEDRLAHAVGPQRREVDRPNLVRAERHRGSA